MKVFNRDVTTRSVFLALVVLIAGLLLFVGVRSYFEWRSDQYFGEVIRTIDGGVVISDIGVGERVINISKGTIIKKGRQTLVDGVAVGDHLVVVGERRDDGSVDAVLMRIVEDNGKGVFSPRDAGR